MCDRCYQYESDSGALPRYTYAGNLQRIRKAATRFFQDALSSATSDSMILFGFPGVAKTTIIETALRRCSLRASFLRISCHNLAIHHPSSSACLSELNKILTDHGILPEAVRLTVVVFDEVDEISTAPTDSRAALSVSHVLMVLCEQTSPGFVVVGITNYPGRVDPRVRSRLHKPLYVPLPDIDALVPIISRKVGSLNAHVVVAALISKVNGRRAVVTMRTLTDGLKFAEAVAKSQGLKLRACNTDQIVDWILTGGPLHTIGEVESYEGNAEHRLLMERSQLLQSALKL